MLFLEIARKRTAESENIENGVGVVTVDDVLDLAEREATEDIRPE